MKNILVDSGFWIAASNPNDQHYELVFAWLKKNKTADYRFITTWIVLCESFFMIKYKVGFQTATNLFNAYSRSEFDVFNLEHEHSQRMIQLLHKYRDRDIDLADISLVIAAEHFNTEAILTVDENDFDALRWNKNQHFQLLLRE